MSKLVILSALLLPISTMAQEEEIGTDAEVRISAVTKAEVGQKEDGLIYEGASETPYSGLIREVFPSGSTKSETTVVDGKVHGRGTVWFESG